MPHDSLRLARPVATLGQALAGRYQLIRSLADGRVCSVYLARDTRSGGPVAVKLLAPCAPPSGRDALQREAFILRRVHHANLIACYADHSEAPLPFLALEVADRSLQDRIDRRGPLERHQALLVTLALIDAAEACHAAGVLHRDIKPQNVLFQNSRTLLADFSVASHPALGDAPGMRSGAFVAPELLTDGAPVGPLADLYGLATTLYYALTGWTPYRLHEAAADSPRWAALDAALRRMLFKATRPLPQRTRSLASFKTSLLSALVTTPIPPRRPVRPQHESTELS